jgi:hypothetical protein
MALGHVERFETGGGEQRLGPGMEALPVLHRAGGMISDSTFAGVDGRDQRGKPERLDHLGDIPGERGDPCRLLGVSYVFAEHKAVILDRRAAARGVDYNHVEPGGESLALPRIDVGARETKRRRRLAKVMGEGAAAATAAGDHDLATMAGQQADRRLIDFGCQHLLGASRQHRDPHSHLAHGREDARAIGQRGRRGRGGCQPKKRREPGG